nr:hypothetical protein [Tanacetum cinerariifolium]
MYALLLDTAPNFKPPCPLRGSIGDGILGGILGDYNRTKERSYSCGNASKSASMLKTTCSASKNDNIATSNSYSALYDKEDEEEDVENIPFLILVVFGFRIFPNVSSDHDALTVLQSLPQAVVEDINLKFLRSLPSKWRTHTLIWRNKTDLEEQSLDDLFNSLKIYEAKVNNSSSVGTTTQNIAFLSSSNTDSTNESVSVAASVSAVNAKLVVYSLPNVDSLRRNLGANGLTSLDFDMSKVKCYNCHKKGHFIRKCRSPKDSRRNGVAEPQRRNVSVKTSASNALVSQCDGVGSYDWSFQAEEEPANYALMALSSSSSFSDNEAPSSLYDRFQSSDGYHAVSPPYTGTFMPPKPNLVFNNAPNGIETDHSAFNVKLSPTKPDQDLSHTYRPSVPIIKDWHVETSIPAVTTKPASPKPTSNGKSRNRKECFVCKILDHLIKDCDYHEKKMAQPTARNHAHRGTHKHCTLMTHLNPQRHLVPPTVLTQSKPVSITAVRPVSTDVPKISVTRPRHAKPIFTKPKLPKGPSLKVSTSSPRVTAVKAPMVSVAQGLQGK